MRRPSALFWPLLLIAIGVLMLLQNLDLISPKVWGAFWALVLIALGAWTLVGVFAPRRTGVESVRQTLDGAGTARIKLNHGAGRLFIKSGSDPAEMFSGSFQGGLDYSVDRDGAEARVRLRTPAANFPFWTWGPGERYDWEVSLNPNIPLALRLRTGASEARFDLSGLRVTELDLKTGASSNEITLPASAGFTRVDIDGGATSIALRVPPGVAARLRVRGGAYTANVDTARFPRTGDVYQSPDYEAAANKVEIKADLGAGSLDVK